MTLKCPGPVFVSIRQMKQQILDAMNIQTRQPGGDFWPNSLERRDGKMVILPGAGRVFHTGTAWNLLATELHDRIHLDTCPLG